jgi:DNA polymerase
MTAEQKERVAAFLGLTSDYLRNGYKTTCEPLSFMDDEEGAPAAPAPAKEAGAADSLEAAARDIAACASCSLAKTRTKTVPGEGAPHPLVAVVGEAPGAQEDALGKPFVGNAGRLLDRMLGAVNLSRTSNCFILNVVKCRPPGNRDPLPEEAGACEPFLSRQIALLRPRAILCVGRVPAQRLLKSAETIGKLRGRFFMYAGIPLLPTFHPSALLRDERLKRPAWEDLKALRGKLIELDEAYALEAQEPYAL